MNVDVWFRRDNLQMLESCKKEIKAFWRYLTQPLHGSFRFGQIPQYSDVQNHFRTLFVRVFSDLAETYLRPRLS
jgi:hypothetical protein